MLEDFIYFISYHFVFLNKYNRKCNYRLLLLSFIVVFRGLVSNDLNSGHKIWSECKLCVILMLNFTYSHLVC